MPANANYGTQASRTKPDHGKKKTKKKSKK